MTLTPDDRARCAAALRPVSPETLMQWAEWANANAGFEERHGDLAAVDRWAGLAALALAAARHALTYPKIREERDAILIKLADRLANVTAGGKQVGMYQEEHDPNNCSQCDKGAPCDVLAGNGALDCAIMIIKGEAK